MRLRSESSRYRRWFLAFGLALLIVVVYFLLREYWEAGFRFARLREYWADPEAHSDWSLKAGQRCGDAPFLQPTDGFLAFLYGDRYRDGRRHQGIDIFGPTGPEGLGLTPVIAAYSGYLSRLPDWKATVIIRIPSDPLQPSRQIWTYYTHMANAAGESFVSEAYPPGIYEVFVEAGTLLGYQGNYSADPANPTGMHLHFSIVRDNGKGEFLNELEFKNTLDPSPYLGFTVYAENQPAEIVVCEPSS